MEPGSSPNFARAQRDCIYTYSTMPFSITLKAYSKIILHCCKYPHRAVNGVVIGFVSAKDHAVQIQDAIPLFHLSLGLAPMLEVALSQIDVYCKIMGLSIVGYYHANERLEDSSPSETAQSVASKIASNCEKPVSCLLMVNNEKITDELNLALKLFTRVESGSHWKEHSVEKELSLTDGEQVLTVTRKLVEKRLFDQLVDFDDHLDNIQLDWTNPDISRAAASYLI